MGSFCRFITKFSFKSISVPDYKTTNVEMLKWEWILIQASVYWHNQCRWRKMQHNHSLHCLVWKVWNQVLQIVLLTAADALHNLVNLSFSLSFTKHLEQVMPKTSVAPAALQPILASSQQPVLLTAKLSSALLPSTGPVHQLHIFNPQPGTATVPPGTTNATQPCPGSAQPGFNIIQPCPSITMTLSTNISQFNTSSTKHNAQLPSILISPQPSKPHAVSSAQANSDSANTGTPPTARSCEPCPNTPVSTTSKQWQKKIFI